MAGVSGASKQQYPGNRSNMPEVLNIIGTITTNGAAPTRTFGRGFVVTQQGTGLYRVAFNINTPRIVGVTAMLVKAAPSQTFLEIQDMLASNNYVTFRVVNNAGAAVAPGAVGDQITFDINVMTVKLPVV
jgi:hypothetical protein